MLWYSILISILQGPESPENYVVSWYQSNPHYSNLKLHGSWSLFEKEI